MNKKSLFIAAVVAALSVSAASASTITGYEGVTNGIYNITPEKSMKDVGFRAYNDFTLDEGHIANLIFTKDGVRDIQAFINLVKNGVNINGILNSMRDGEFYNGHAIFITPGGMAIGQSGVVNVGTLSVATPTEAKYQELLGEYQVNNFDNIRNVSDLKFNHSGHAPISVDGKIFTRNGAELIGSSVNVASTGGIVNGLAEMNQITSKAQAQALFDNLVNTSGIKATSDMILANNGSRILIKSADTEDATGINVAGKVANLVDGGVYLTNYGATNGLKTSGTIASNGALQLLNQKGAMEVGGVLKNKDADISLTNKGTTFKTTGTFTTNKNLNLVNKGSGKMTVDGVLDAERHVNVVNKNGNGLEVKGTLGGENTVKVAIDNRTGKLTLTSASRINATDLALVSNQGAGGMEIAGTVNSGRHTHVKNELGNMAITGTVKVADAEGAKLHIENLATAGGVTISGNVEGYNELAIKNSGTRGMTISGNIVSRGETAINNLNGGLTVANGAKIDFANGNMGIINQGGKFKVENGAQIVKTVFNDGKLKLVNTGADGMEIAGKVDNTGDTYLYNDNGKLVIKSTADIANEGDMYIVTRKNSTGITTEEGSQIRNYYGELAIKNTGVAAGGGMDLNGTITKEYTNAEVAINNYNGDMHVGGTINVDGNLGIINRGADTLSDGVVVPGGKAMTVDAKVTGHDINVKNYGSGDMTVGGEITHDGRLNVLANSGKLTLDGTITNNGNEMTYAAARANGTGVETTTNFVVNSETGDVLIRNITGANGLTHQGSITAEGGQAAVVNKKGNAVVNGSVAGYDVVVSNTRQAGTLDLTNARLNGDHVVNVANSGAALAVTDGIEVILKEEDVTSDTSKWLHQDKKFYE